MLISQTNFGIFTNCSKRSKKCPTNFSNYAFLNTIVFLFFYLLKHISIQPVDSVCKIAQNIVNAMIISPPDQPLYTINGQLLRAVFFSSFSPPPISRS